jgi:hypothetical protein
MSRCDERLKARVEETCLTYTGLHLTSGLTRNFSFFWEKK